MPEKDKNDPFESHKKGSAWGSIWGAKPQPEKKPETAPGKGYKENDKRAQPISFVKLFFFPMSFFIFTALSFMFLWELVPGVPMLLAFAMLCSVFDFSSIGAQFDEQGHEVNSFLPSLSGPHAMRAMRVWLHIVVAWVGVFLGSVAGINADESHLSQFYAIRFGQKYENIKAITPGAAFTDAGEVSLANSSTVHGSKSVGFKDKLVFCAAPIIDKAQGRKPISLWAIGYDCCDPRGKFKCGDGEAGRKGVRAPPDGIFHVDHGLFLKAVSLSAAVHNLDVGQDIILLRWVKDADEEALRKFFAAVLTVLLGAALFAIFVLVMTGIGLTAEHEYTMTSSHHSLTEDLA